MMLDKQSKIYVAGHNGLVGSTIWNNLLQRGYTNLVGRSHKELVEAPLDDDVQCLELDETVKVTVGDREVRQHLLEHFDISDSIKVQTLDKELRNEIIISCLELGTGLRQLSRLTGVTYGVINRINNKKLRD